MATQEMVATEINANNPTDENNQPEEQKANESTADKPGHPVDPSINLEGPTIFNIPNSVEEQKVNKFCNKDVKIRITRWTFLAFMPCIFLLVLTYQKRSTGVIHLSFLIGIGITIMYLIYFGLIGVLFYSGSQLKKDRSLFRIWTKADAVPGWATMSIAVNQQLYHFEAIQSISEFSAVDGGVPSFMLANLGPFTWAVVTLHFAAELHYNPIFEWDIADCFEIIGVAGLVMIGMFELDPYNPSMRKFHYLGAVAGVGTILGYVVQGWSMMEAKGKVTYFVAPIIIGVIAVIYFISWQISNRRTEQKQEEIREKYKGNKPNEEEMQEIKKTITRLSLRNVITEGIFLFCGALSLALWLIHYEEECCCGCAGHSDDLTCPGICN